MIRQLVRAVTGIVVRLKEEWVTMKRIESMKLVRPIAMYTEVDANSFHGLGKEILELRDYAIKLEKRLKIVSIVSFVSSTTIGGIAIAMMIFR